MPTQFTYPGLYLGNARYAGRGPSSTASTSTGGDSGGGDSGGGGEEPDEGDCACSGFQSLASTVELWVGICAMNSVPNQCIGGSFE